ncbi:dienelactone hydrolase family protein [Candidatus Allofournierella merdavium]|uniref:dienelactone hydrolase family protein n=1 Tax=Candidatus Allofournierella merdavium TaxID=2838593 RepID=UPI00374EF36C
MKKYFTLSTKEGSARLLALFLALILVCSFAARMVSTDGGNVKISRVVFDSRGATIDAQLYYPAGTSDADSLPAVLVAHGAGVGEGNLRGISEELARRGFVVLNSNAYNMGLSEQPINDEFDFGVDQFNRGGTPHGLLDAVEFLRTLKFVDQTRIGIVGHSLGARRGGYAVAADCGYLTFNDIMVNVLHDTFGQTFTAQEITRPADELAAERLNADQLARYEALKAENRDHYDTRILALCLLGYSANDVPQLQIQTVSVGGHEVTRNCQVNLGLISGVYDFGHREYYNNDATKANWYTNGENVQLDEWYAVDDLTQSSRQLGSILETSVVENTDLAAAIQARTSRIFGMTPESHAKNNFSTYTASDVVKYFEQIFAYNGGELTDASTVSVDASGTVFLWRESLNFLAMIFMICAVIAAAGLLLKTEFFAGCVAAAETGAGGFSKAWYWIFSALGIALGFFAIWKANSIFGFLLPYFSFLPFFESWWYAYLFIAIVAIGSLVLLVLAWLRERNTAGGANLRSLHLKMPVRSVLKTLLLAAVLLAFAYLTLMVIVYLFDQDYRLWMAVFTEMKVEYWRYIWRLFLVFMPCCLAIGALTNYVIRKDLPGWADTALTVVINSAGVWLCCIVECITMVVADRSFSSFVSTYQMIILIPITVYITRKMFKLTNSIWLGAAMNSLLIAWSICSSTGLNLDRYLPQTWMSVFFNI